MTKLAHQVLDDDRVLVSLVGRGALHVTAAEARRFAWALLADLDPDETLEAKPPPTKPGPPKREPGRAGAWRQVQVLQALSRGLRTPHMIAEKIGVTPEAAGVTLAKLAKHGFVTQTSRGRPRHPARWAITEAGIAELAELQIDRAAA